MTAYHLVDLMYHETEMELGVIFRKGRDEAFEEHVRNQGYDTDRIRSYNIALDSTEVLDKLLEDWDLLVTAVPHSRFCPEMIDAALRSRVDLVDLYGHRGRLKLLRQHLETIRDYGHCFLAESGVLPGLPVMMARYAQEKIHRLERIHVYAINLKDWLSVPKDSSIKRELFRLEHGYNTGYYKSGSWLNQIDAGIRQFEFRQGLGKLKCKPVIYEDLREFQEKLPELKELGVWLCGSSPFVNRFLNPLHQITPGFFEGLQASLFARANRSFTADRSGICLVMQAQGTDDTGQSVKFNLEIFHPDSCALTALVTVESINQLRQGLFSCELGICLQGMVVDPARMLEAMKDKGVTVEETLEVAD